MSFLFPSKFTKNRQKWPKIAKYGISVLKKSNVALQVSYFSTDFAIEGKHIVVGEQFITGVYRSVLLEKE